MSLALHPRTSRAKKKSNTKRNTFRVEVAMAEKAERIRRLVLFSKHYVKWPPSRAAFAVHIDDHPPTPPPPETAKEARARKRLEKENEGKVPHPMNEFYNRRQLKLIGRRRPKWFPKDHGPFDQLDIEPWSLRMLKEYTKATVKY
ncbi:hypothetical protein BSKO_12397 [Bryopsis sp. KO-2023]|nr:hypothetical protein BSKO_12397 [Bryopsis sp. KO-2023]